MSEQIFLYICERNGSSNVWRHNFLQPVTLSVVGETMAHIWPQVMEIAAFQVLYKNDRFLNPPPPPVASIWLIFLEVFILLT